ncbi:2-hydroxyacid dehydrogenase [Thermoflexus sp.]|uniref:2-hydroxyacid dehydrogenase n=1 Tax=Thermoflexus sp. TaxID=1969742 RepID=UPI0035E42F30
MAKPKVYITRRIPERAFEILREHAELKVWDSDLPVPREVLLQEVADVEGLLCLLTEKVNAELLDAAPRLKVVSNMAVGFDNIDVAECTRRGIPVGNTPGVLTEATADLTWTLLLAAARRIREGIDYVRGGHWVTWGPLLLLGQDVYGATLGIIGMGRIGTAVARRAKGFHMRILYHDVRRNEAAEAELGAVFVDLDTLLRESDFITIHTDLNPSTYRMINREAFAKMKPTAVLVNAARGPIVDTEALYEALREGRIFAAALDVTDPEPLPADHPLLQLPNCIVVPHIGSATVTTRNRMAELAALNVLAGLRGERLPHCVNPEVYEQPRGT